MIDSYEYNFNKWIITEYQDKFIKDVILAKVIIQHGSLKLTFEFLTSKTASKNKKFLHDYAINRINEIIKNTGK